MTFSSGEIRTIMIKALQQLIHEIHTSTDEPTSTAHLSGALESTLTGKQGYWVVGVLVTDNSELAHQTEAIFD